MFDHFLTLWMKVSTQILLLFLLSPHSLKIIKLSEACKSHRKYRKVAMQKNYYYEIIAGKKILDLLLSKFHSFIISHFFTVLLFHIYEFDYWMNKTSNNCLCNWDTFRQKVIFTNTENEMRKGDKNRFSMKF